MYTNTSTDILVEELSQDIEVIESTQEGLFSEDSTSDLVLTQQSKETKMKRMITTTSTAVAIRQQAIRIINDTISLANLDKACFEVINGNVKYRGLVDSEVGREIRNAIYQWLRKGMGKVDVESAEYLMNCVARGEGSTCETQVVDAQLAALVPAYQEAKQHLQMSHSNAPGFNKDGTRAVVSGGSVKFTWYPLDDNGNVVNNALVRVGSLLKLDEIKPVTRRFTAEDFTTKSSVWSRIMLSAEGKHYILKQDSMFNLPSNGKPGKLWNHCNSLSFSDVAVLSELAQGFDMKSLEANIASYYNYTFYVTKKGKKVYMAQSPMTAMKFYQDFGYWGVTGLDGYSKKGLANAFQVSPMWLEAVEGVPCSTEKGNKSIARVDKLNKELLRNIHGQGYGVKGTLRNLFVVTGWVKATQAALESLSIGNIFVGPSDYRKYGSARVVSGACFGGIKATLQPVEDISKTLFNADWGLISFGSAKAAMNGIANARWLKGLITDETKKVTKTIDICGEDVTVTGYVLPCPEVIFTNFYTIQQYQPSDLDRFNMTKVELLGEKVAKVANKVSLINEDKDFVNFVLAESAKIGDNLTKALQQLLEDGVIVEKPFVTDVTPTEYDVVALTHGTKIAEQFMDALLKSPLNKGKFTEAAQAKAILDNRVDENDVYDYTVSTVMNMYLAAMKPIFGEDGQMVWSGTTPAVMSSGTPNRNALSLFTSMLYQTMDNKCSKGYIRISTGFVNEAGFEDSVIIPTGKFFEGATFNSNPEIENIVASGFLDKMRKYLEFGVQELSLGNELSDKVTSTFVQNVRRELESTMFGKSFGKLKAVGTYFVLGVAPWAKEIHHKYVADFKRFNGKDCGWIIGAKMPLWTLQAHAAYYGMDKRMHLDTLDYLTEEQKEENLFLSRCVSYEHAMSALALNNDSDGDLKRNIALNVRMGKFTAAVLKPTYIHNEFFNNYVKGELEYAKEVCKELKPIEDGWAGLYQEHTNAATAKENVAKFTSKYFLYMQTYGIKREEKPAQYVFKADLLGSFVQYAMNSIKHKNSANNCPVTGLYASEKFGATVESREKCLLTYAEASNLDVSKKVGSKTVKELLAELAVEVHSMLANGRSDVAELLTQDRSPLEVAEMPFYGMGSNVVLNSTNGLLGRLLTKLWKC